MEFRPLHDNVLIKVIEKEGRTKSGIFIPDTAQEKSKMGKVVAVGKGSMKKGVLIPLEVEVGQNVLFSSYSDTKVKLEDEEYLVLSESSILAVLD